MFYGRRVIEGELPPAGRTRVAVPAREIRRLREYLAGRFASERETIDKLSSRVVRNADPLSLFSLSARALAFRHELVSWQAFAQRLWDEGHAGQLEAVRSHYESELAAERTGKRSVKELEAQARAELAPLKQALDLISLTSEQMKSVLFWSQAMAKVVEHEDAFTDRDIDEAAFEFPVIGASEDAPIEEALLRLEESAA